jgi:hypothetical protein
MEAVRMGKKVIVIDEIEIELRDHMGGKAVELYRKIIENGAIVVKSKDEIINYL